MATKNLRNKAHVLVVDDDSLARYSLGEMLRLDGYSADTVENAELALAKVKNQNIDAIIADVTMPGLNGFDLLKIVKQQQPDMGVILVTGFGSINDAVKGMKLGAHEYLTKPLNDSELKEALERVLEKKRREMYQFKDSPGDFHFDSLIGSDLKMKRILHLLLSFADSDATILVCGPNGTGKSTLARALHYQSRRKDRPLVEISCGALSENLLESELFGHVRGSFTSAISDKMGKLEKAEGGTVFLDEIDTLSLRLQVKLLRFLQDKKFERVGSTDTIHTNVRVIAAANRDLKKCVEEGEFRQDLLYRVNVVSVQLPALVERLGDLPAIVEHFIKKYNNASSKSVVGISDEVLERLLSHDWPGNVRELENVIERAVILATTDHITLDLLPDYLIHPAHSGGESSHGLLPLDVAAQNANKGAILKALSYFRGNRTKTAEYLGINRTTLYKKMKKYGITDEAV